MTRLTVLLGMIACLMLLIVKRIGAIFISEPLTSSVTISVGLLVILCSVFIIWLGFKIATMFENDKN